MSQPSIKRLMTKRSMLSKRFILKSVENYNKMQNNICKIVDIVNIGDTFEITGYEKIQTTHGEKNIATIIKDGNTHKAWATTDIIKLIQNEPFDKIWKDPSFSSFVMEYSGLIGNKYLFKLLDIKTSTSDSVFENISDVENVE